MREMSVLVGKDLRLANRPLFAIFLAMDALLLVPTYPLHVALMWVCLAIFQTQLHFRESNDVSFSMLLPIRKRDLVRGRVLFCCLVEVLQLLVAVPFAMLRRWLDPGAPVGFEANPALFGSALIMYTLFNAIFFTMHFRTGYALGLPFLCAGLATMVYLGVAEAAANLPSLAPVLAATDRAALPPQLGVLLLGVLLFTLGNWLTYRIAATRFERVDL
ncbi:ABC-2 family transporter [Propionibacteriaceae bacterium ES.041]|nr:hypothetical protein CGZ96_05875 [Enemella evansiae]PFG66762.1 ABC-2 family transporter [Propionibacteriaceae bacterium ES.041]